MHEHGETPVLVAEVEAATTAEHGVAVADVDDVVLVNLAVVVDIGIFGITGIAAIAAVRHDDGFALKVDHHIAISILGIGVFGVLVNAEILVAEERAHGCSAHDAGGIVAVAHGVVLLLIAGHTDDFVLIATDVEVHLQLPVLGLDSLPVGAELDTLVSQRTGIVVGEVVVGIARRTGDVELLLQQVYGLLVIVVERTRELAFPEVEVETEVPLCGAFPLQFVQLHGVCRDGVAVHIGTQGGIGSYVGRGAAGGVTALTEASSYLQFGEHILRPFHEGLIGKLPGETH